MTSRYARAAGRRREEVRELGAAAGEKIARRVIEGLLSGEYQASNAIATGQSASAELLALKPELLASGYAPSEIDLFLDAAVSRFRDVTGSFRAGLSQPGVRQ